MVIYLLYSLKVGAFHLMSFPKFNNNNLLLDILLIY